MQNIPAIFRATPSLRKPYRKVPCAAPEGEATSFVVIFSTL
jgi:hypothetical protein